MMQGSFVNTFENRNTDTATCNDICTFVKAGSGNWISQMNVGHLFVFLSFTNCDLVAEVVISDGEN